MEVNGGEGGQVGIDGVGYVVVDPTTFTTSSPSFLSLSLTDQLLINSANQRNSQINSQVVNITVIGSAEITSSLQICLLANQTSKKDACLGYIDEKDDPPQWKCEDRCLTKQSGDYYCGDTKHLTSFAILFEGIAKGSGDNCGDERDYILGDYDQDLILVASVAGIIIIIAILVFILFSYTPLKKYAYGREGSRAAKLRSIQEDFNKMNTDDNLT